MKVNRMKTGDWGKVKAFFDVESNGMIIKGFKLVEGINGLFVGMPSVKNKEDKYDNIVYIPKNEHLDNLRDLAISIYEKESGVSATPQQTTDDDIPF